MIRAGDVPFGGSGLDRAAHLRGTAKAHDRARTIILWRGRALCAQQNLVRLPACQQSLPSADLLLGMENSQPIRACALPADHDEVAAQAIAETLSPGAHFTDLRDAMAMLSARDAELWATARSLFEWHRNHGFCAACGQPSNSAQDGWQRDCISCGTPHFPRTDPVVIMLVTHGNDVLLGRSPGWPEGMYSLLAGFIEPGESMEAAVAREVFEETGISCGPAHYLTSQPWPFPSSLMLGCATEATTTKITTDPNEIEDALWMSRESLARAFAGHGDGAGHGGRAISPARPGSMAHFLLRNWLADRLA